MTYTQLRLAMEGGGLVPASTTCASTPAHLSWHQALEHVLPGAQPLLQDAAPCVLAGTTHLSCKPAHVGGSREGSGVRLEGGSANLNDYVSRQRL